ncbi:MAG: M23 family metallopeptidase [Firmicutes bacterium]|nr:M23 family metallopeptidase [Bacillota bacterium]
MSPSMDAAQGVYKRAGSIVTGIMGMGRVYLGASSVLVISVFALIISQFIFFTVSIDGTPTMLVENRGTAKKAIVLLLEKEEKRRGYPVYWQQVIEINPVWGNDGRRCYKSVENVAGVLRRKLQFVTDGVAVTVNKEEKLYMRNIEVARQSLGLIKDKFRPRGALKVSFEEDVQIVNKTVSVKQLVDRDNAIGILMAGVQKIENYEVKKGDTLWGIARRKGHDIKELMDINKGVKPHLLQIGQKIKLNKQQPLLNVISSYETVELRDVPYTIVEAGRDPSLNYGEVKVIQQGVPGRMEITYRVVERNGERIKKYPVHKTIKSDPRPQVVVSGSEMIMASRSGRTIYRPVVGTVSSNYGMRGGGVHSGIDFAADYGNPVVALAAGTVKFAGCRGGYGIAVDIDHGQGMITRYAHLSKAVVSTGQKVKGGQLIGRVGATGNATGPHLHLEVRVNGETQDPGHIL